MQRISGYLLELIKRFRRPALPTLFLLVLLLAVPLPLSAQQAPLTAEVDRNSVTTDEVVVLTVVVSGPRASQPTLPVLQGFQIVGTSSATQVTIVNADMTTQATYRYELRPTQTGELIIGPISAIIDDQTYTTEPITIQVAQGTGAPPGNSSPTQGQPAPSQLEGQSFFVTAEVDNLTPYLGEQIIYTFRFFQGDNVLQQPVYDAPEFAGFWSQETEQQERYVVEDQGRAYRVTALQTILFPTVAGEHTIEPATLTIPGDLFQASQTLSTEAVNVSVQPLPEPAPETFSGAVGQFEVTSTADTTAVAVNEPVTLRLTIAGWGNIEALPEPAWPALEGWRAFDSTVTTNTAMQDGRFTGERIYERIMIPGVMGDFTIPAITYTYFDPEAATYETASTLPIPVTVAAGAAEPDIPQVPVEGQEPVERLATDIRHIKPVPTTLEGASESLLDQPIYWLGWFIPLLLLGADYAWQRRRQQHAANPEWVRRSQAQKRARQLLQQGRKEQGDPYAAIDRALTGYLNDKLDRPVTGLTQSALADLLRRRGVAETLIEHVHNLRSLSEMGRFAPVGGDGNRASELFQEAERLLVELERELS